MITAGVDGSSLQTKAYGE